ncbi:MAG: zinc-ribbon domain-containing protein, partial [Draconibacterium sp.]
MAYCTQCGKSLLPVAKFCPACGTQIITDQSKTYASGYKEILFFSFLVLLLVFIRMKKPKPYNGLIKLLVVVQVVFLAAL